MTGTSDQLAQAIGTRWRREEEQRRVQDPFPLPVGWRSAPEAFNDHWANICRTPAGETADGALSRMMWCTTPHDDPACPGGPHRNDSVIALSQQIPVPASRWRPCRRQRCPS
jgi:hypothetical protein